MAYLTLYFRIKNGWEMLSGFHGNATPWSYNYWLLHSGGITPTPKKPHNSRLSDLHYLDVIPIQHFHARAHKHYNCASLAVCIRCGSRRRNTFSLSRLLRCERSTALQHQACLGLLGSNLKRVFWFRSGFCFPASLQFCSMNAWSTRIKTFWFLRRSITHGRDLGPTIWEGVLHVVRGIVLTLDF